MNHSSRLDLIPPYLFAELERKISEKKAAGIDVISLGIGDPDIPTFPEVVEAGQNALANASTHQYPSNRGRAEFRQAMSAFYQRRFGVTLDPETEIMPAIGAKECIFNLNLAFLDSESLALASDPGYPVYTAGPLLVGSSFHLMPLVPELGFTPDLDAIPAEVAAKARLMFINYPNNPTGAIAPDGFFEKVVAFAAKHNILVVHDNAYSETTYDGYVAPSFLATEGAREIGVEVFSLSKGWNMTGWRCAAIVGNPDAIAAYWKLKSNVDSGLFEAIQLAGAAALDESVQPRIEEMRVIYDRRRKLVVSALAAAGVEVQAPKGTIYIWAPIPAGYSTAAEYCEHVLEQAAVVISPGGAYGPNGEGFFRISLTTPDERLEEAVARISKLGN